MLIQLKYAQSSCSESQLTNFIKGNYEQFGTDFKTICEKNNYPSKLYSKSEKFECWDNCNLVGIICAYFNFETNLVYIPYVCVDIRYKGLGIASGLMENIIRVAQDKDFKAISLEVKINNIPALNLYQKKGFKEISRNTNKIQLSRDINGK